MPVKLERHNDETGEWELIGYSEDGEVSDDELLNFYPEYVWREKEPEWFAERIDGPYVMASVVDAEDIDKGKRTLGMFNKSWVPYQGERGGTGWQDTESGEVIYQEEPPGPLDDEALSEAQMQEIRENIDPDDGRSQTNDSLRVPEEVEEFASQIDSMTEGVDRSDPGETFEAYMDINSFVGEELGSFGRSVDLPKFREDDSTINLERTKEAAVQYAKMEEAGYMDGLTSVKELEKRGEESAHGRYLFKFERLEINTNWDDEKLKEYHEDGETVGDDMEWLVLHEFAHHQHKETLEDKDEVDRLDFPERASGLFDGFDGELPWTISEEISDYARTNPSEFVAEVFCAKAYGQDIPEQLEEMYEKAGGPENWDNFRNMMGYDEEPRFEKEQSDSTTLSEPLQNAADETWESFREWRSETQAAPDEKGPTVFKSWVPYIGPNDGTGWQSTSDGDVVYDDEPPGQKVGMNEVLYEHLDMDIDSLDVIAEATKEVRDEKDLTGDEFKDLRNYIAGNFVRIVDDESLDLETQEVERLTEEMVDSWIDNRQGSEDLIDQYADLMPETEVIDSDSVDSGTIYDALIMGAPHQAGMPRVIDESDDPDQMIEDAILRIHERAEEGNMQRDPENSVASMLSTLDRNLPESYAEFSDESEIRETPTDQRLDEAFDMAKYKWDARAYGISGGNTTGDKMDIVEYSDGSIDFAIPKSAYPGTTGVVDSEEEAVENNKSNPLVENALGGNSVKTSIVEDEGGETYIVKQGLEGDTLGYDGLDTSDPAYDSAVDSMAAAFFTGHSDLHGENVFVTEDDEFHIIDHDACGKRFGSWPRVSRYARHGVEKSDVRPEIHQRAYDLIMGRRQIPDEVGVKHRGWLVEAVEKAMDDAKDEGDIPDSVAERYEKYENGDVNELIPDSPVEGSDEVLNSLSDEEQDEALSTDEDDEPFGNYEECVDYHGDKNDPEAYCAAVFGFAGDVPDETETDESESGESQDQVFYSDVDINYKS